MDWSGLSFTDKNLYHNARSDTKKKVINVRELFDNRSIMTDKILETLSSEEVLELTFNNNSFPMITEY